MSDTFRKEYRSLSPENASRIQSIKLQADHIEVAMSKVKSREMSLAITNLEQSIMWAVKAIVLDDEKVTK
jgi:hypothetical protein